MLKDADVERISARLTGQDKTIFWLACETGLRISDVLRVRNRDIRDTSVLLITEQKTGKDKACVLIPALYKHLMQRYVSRREDSKDDYIFKPTGYMWGGGKHYSRQNYYRHLKEVCKALKIDISPHSTRKYYAMQLYLSSGNIDHVRRMLNHKYITTTCGYLDIDLQDLLSRIPSRDKSGG